MELSFRQGLVRYQINTAGIPSHIQVSGTNTDFIDLNCEEDPLFFTIAHGSANYLIQEPRSVHNAWGPLQAHGQTQYLYWDISLLDASLTRSYTLLFPYSGPNAPANPGYDQHWYDTNEHLTKVWNGSKWLPKLRVFAAVYTDNAILIPYAIGTQVNETGFYKAGSILIGQNGYPLRDFDGTFVTSESNIISAFSSGESIKFEALQLYGQAVEFIPKFSAVTFDKPGKIKLASYNFPDQIINGIITTDLFTGEVAKIVNSGLVRNSQWTFFDNQINKPLYVGEHGEITLVLPPMQVKTVIGYVYDNSAIIVDIQRLGEITTITAPSQVTLIGDVLANGLTTNSITTILSNTGVTPGTYNNVTVDSKGRITNATNLTYLTANENITLNGDITGYGSTSITATLIDTGVTPGTYNNVTVDSKGRVISANNNANVITLSGDVTGSGTSNIISTLSDTGVIPGTYKNVTVDSKGRVINADNAVDPITIIGDASGSGTSSITLVLSNTGVIPGTYNSVTVDSKGRITNATNTVLSDTGVIPGTYNLVTVDSQGRVIDATNIPPVDTTVTLTGDITGTGVGIITTTLSNTGVIPGTYNSVTVDSKGRITNATIQSTLFSTTLTGDITGSGTGTFATTLSDTGVTPGTYNSFTVDAKGRITSASIVPTTFPTTLLGDVIGTGTGTFSTVLSDTGVTPGTYNSVTVDSKGRVINATIQPLNLPDTGVVAGSYFGFTVDAKGRLTDAWNPLPTPTSANTLLGFNGTTYEWISDIDVVPPVTSVNGAIGDVIVNSIYQGNSAVTVLDSTIGSVTTVIDGLTTSTYLANNATLGYDTSSPIWLNSYKFSAANSIFSVTQYGVSFVVDPQSNSYQLINTTSEGTPGQILVKYNAKGVLQWSKTITQYLRFGDTWPLKVFYSTVINRVLLPVSVRTNQGLYINELLILDPESGTQSYLALALPGDNTSNTFPPPFNLRDIDYIEDPSANISSPGYFLLSYIENGISRIAKLNFVTNNPWYYTFTVESVINVSTFVAQKVKFDSTKHFYTAIGDASDAAQNFVGACIIKYDPTLQTEVFQTVLPITDFPSGQMLLDFCYDNNDDIYVTAYTNGSPQFWIFKISGTNGSVIWQKLISDSSVGATTALSPETILFDGSRIIVRYQLYPDASGYFDPRLLALNINGTVAYHYNIIGLPTDHFLPSNICYYHNQYLYLGGDSKIFKYPSDGSLTGDHTTTIGINIIVNTSATITDSTIITSNNQFNLLVQDSLYQIIYSDPFTHFVISNISPWEYTFQLSPLLSNVYNVVLNSTINDGTGNGIYGQVLTSNGNGSPPSWKTPIYDVPVDGTTILMSSTGLSLAPINQPSGPYYTVYVDPYGRVVGGNTAPTGVNWVDIFSTPTTLAGYGITDAYNITAINALTWNWTSITSTPTTLVGYGITDAYTKTEVDALVAGTGGGGGGTFTGGTVTSPIVLSNTVVHEQFATIDPASGNFYGTSTNYITIDTAIGSVFWIDVTTDMGFIFTNAAPFGQVTSFILELRCNAAHSVNFAVSQTVNWASGTAPTLTTNGIGYDTLAFYTHDGGSTWRGLVLGQDMK